MSYHIQKSAKLIPVNDAEYGEYTEMDSFNPYNPMVPAYEEATIKNKKSIARDYVNYQLSKSVSPNKFSRVI